MKLEFLGIGAALIAATASPVEAQSETGNKALGEQLTACVNKAIADNPGPDFTIRYLEVRKCQESIKYQYDENNNKINYQTQIDYKLMRIRSEEKIKSILIDPESANFEWPYGFSYSSWKPFLQSRVTGYVTCGYVNSKNRMGGYAGRMPFVVILNDHVVSFVDIDNGRGLGLVGIACDKSAASLPTPQKGMLDENIMPEIAQPSVADELQKLDALRQKGILSEEEFTQQKARILKN